MHEVHSYIWYEGKKMQDISLEIEDNPKLLNSVTPENTVIRNSMLPTLLCFTYKNKAWADNYNIFEIGRVVQGTKEAIREDGALGILTGPLSSASVGITVAMVSGLVVSFITKPKSK